jgi:hypothetical protein
LIFLALKVIINIGASAIVCVYSAGALSQRTQMALSEQQIVSCFPMYKQFGNITLCDSYKNKNICEAVERIHHVKKSAYQIARLKGGYQRSFNS